MAALEIDVGRRCAVALEVHASCSWWVGSAAPLLCPRRPPPSPTCLQAVTRRSAMSAPGGAARPRRRSARACHGVRRLRSARGARRRARRWRVCAARRRSRPSARHLHSARGGGGRRTSRRLGSAVNYARQSIETRLTRGSQTAQLLSITGWAGWFRKPAKSGP